MKPTLRLILALVIAGIGSPRAWTAPSLPPGPITFVHEDSGSSQPGKQIFTICDCSIHGIRRSGWR